MHLLEWLHWSPHQQLLDEMWCSAVVAAVVVLMVMVVVVVVIDVVAVAFVV